MTRVAAVVFLAFLGVACRVEHDSSLVVRETHEGAGGAGGVGFVTVEASWTYRSGDVDIDAVLSTEHAGDACTTVGRLLINKVLSAPERYSTDELPCAELELTDEGDIVLYGVPTGHDWSVEDLLVNRDDEILSLGPWAPDDGSGAVRYELSAPDCGGCACPQLVRRRPDEVALLPLGRDCD